MGGGHLWRLCTQVHHRPNPVRLRHSLLVPLLTDLTVVLTAVVGGVAFVLFALGLIICLVKKK